MTDLDLNSLNLTDLKQLQKDVAKAISGFEDHKKSEARAALEAQAKKLGYTLAGLVGSPALRAKAAVAPKYRHPENASVTWSGRGRRPRWFVDALSAGKSAKSLAV